jgi:N-acyl-D-amino-acid deacylase
MFDLIIRNGKIITGTGNPWFKADIAVKNGEITEIGYITQDAAKTIDAKGLAVSPGVIDLHDHSDSTILVDREATSKVHMGVSTTTFPSCGSGTAPLNEELREYMRRTQPFLEEAGIDINWSTVEEYFTLLESGGLSINVAPLIAFGTVRQYVLGMAMRAPTPTELEEMKKQVEIGMKAGCRGITTGLRYDPQSYASTEEVIEVSKVAAKYGGFYTSHVRDEGDRGDPVSAIEEIIRISREANIPVNISHFKVLSRRFFDQCPKLIEMVNTAREEGLMVTADQYPYNASGTGLGAWIPKWANEGGPEELLKRLNDPESVEKIKEVLAISMDDRGGPEAALISSYPLNPEMVSKTIADVSEMRKQDPLDCAIGLLRDHLEAVLTGKVKGGFSIVNFNQSEENIELIMKQPWVAFGTDSSVHKPTGILNKHHPAPHPRYYGTFPRVLGRYVREKQVITLEDAVRKMTSLPAQTLGLRDRGILAPGFKADIMVFDPDTVLDKSDFVPPEATKRFPEGIIHLVVNGAVTMEDGEHTGARAGLIPRR